MTLNYYFHNQTLTVLQISDPYRLRKIEWFHFYTDTKHLSIDSECTNAPNKNFVLAVHGARPQSHNSFLTSIAMYRMRAYVYAGICDVPNSEIELMCWFYGFIEVNERIHKEQQFSCDDDIFMVWRKWKRLQVCSELFKAIQKSNFITRHLLICP